MTYQNEDNTGGGQGFNNDQGGRGGFRGGRGGFNREPRQLVDVTALGIKCANCGTDVTQLPFQPDPARLNTIRCRDCLRKSRPPRY
ncbi:MAG: hypothetical protein ABIJ81_03310 [Patescibacteria group bacterium]